jgi:uncharacterized protein YndB with AHSA1/START domain
MTYAFTIDDEIDVDAAPEEVWRALTVGPRIDSWFMGRNEVEPRAGGTARTELDGFVMTSTVTAWDPPKRLTYQDGNGSDGPFTEFDWRIEPRLGGGSTVHFTHRGRVAGEDGHAEYEALKKGDPMYVRKLARYPEFFNGQTACRNIVAQGASLIDSEQFWSTLKRTLGLRAAVTEWDPVQAALDGLGTIDGVVDYVTPEFLGVRTRTGLYRFIHGLGGIVVVEHHDFSPSPNGYGSAEAWGAWLAKEFS